MSEGNQAADTKEIEASTPDQSLDAMKHQVVEGVPSKAFLRGLGYLSAGSHYTDASTDAGFSTPDLPRPAHQIVHTKDAEAY